MRDHGDVIWTCWAVMLLLLIGTPTSFSYTAIPTIRCPVGTDLASALMFKYANVQGIETDEATKILLITLISQLKDKSEDELRTLLKGELSITDTMSDDVLIDIASLYYGLGKTGASPSYEELRFQAENAVAGAMETASSRKYFRWHRASFTDQELIMLKCSSQMRFPIGSELPYEDDETRCYLSTVVDTLTKIGDYSEDLCRLKCRADNSVFMFSNVGGSQDCYCSKTIPSGRKSKDDGCLDADYLLKSTGLGLPLLTFAAPVHPKYPTTTDGVFTTAVDAAIYTDPGWKLDDLKFDGSNNVIGSQIIQIGGSQFYVVLFPRRVAVFKILEPELPTPGTYAWEDPDQSPSLVFVSEVGWRAISDIQATGRLVGTVQELWDNGKQKRIMQLENPSEPFNQDAKIRESYLTDATSMTIIPVYVRFDEVILPDLAVSYDVFGNIDTNDANYKKAVSGKPIPGGKWFYHVLITHGDQVKTMNALKIDSDGSLIQLLARINDKGNFLVPQLSTSSNVLSITSFNQGRASYFIAATLQELRAFRLTEEIEEQTVGHYSKHSYLRSNTLGSEKLDADILNVVKLDFLTKHLVAVLLPSELRIYQFNSQENVNILILLAKVSLSGFDKMESFAQGPNRYLVLTGTNKIQNFLVKPSGVPVEIDAQEVTDVVQAIPLRGRNKEETKLLTVKKTSNSVDLEVSTFSSEDNQWNANPVKSLTLSEGLTDPHVSVTYLAKMKRFVGINIVPAEDPATNLFALQFFVVPNLPNVVIDTRLQQESLLIRTSHGLLASTEDYQAIKADLDKYLKKSGSKVTGDWTIGNVNTGSLVAASIPDASSITLNIKNPDGSEPIVKTNAENYLAIDTSAVKTKLDAAKTRLTTLDGQRSNLLLKSSLGPQTVEGEVVVDGVLAVEEKFFFEKQSGGTGKFILNELKKGEKTLDVSDLDNIYSKDQNSGTITGTVVLKGKASFDGNLQATKMSSVYPDSTPTVEHTLANVLKVTGGQSFTGAQTFLEGIQVTGDVTLGAGLGLRKGSARWSLDDLVDSGVFANKKLTLNDVKVEGDGLTAANIDSDFLTTDTNAVAANSGDLVSIKGTVKLIAPANHVFSTQGQKVSVVDGNVNNHNVKNLYENCAWATKPNSLYDITPDSTISFLEDVIVNKAVINTDLNVDSINGAPYDDYLRIDKTFNDDRYANLFGKKTFSSSVTASNLRSGTFNSMTTDQFLTKSSPQTITGHSTFNAGVTFKSVSSDPSASGCTSVYSVTGATSDSNANGYYYSYDMSSDRPAYQKNTNDMFLVYVGDFWVVKDKDGNAIIASGASTDVCPPTGSWPGSLVIAAVGDYDICYPYVDGVCLKHQLSLDLPSLASDAMHIEDNKVDRNTQFSKVILAAGASLSIEDKINNVDILARAGQLVRSDEASVTISGDKTFSSAVSASKVQVNSIATDFVNGASTKSYQVEHFLSNKNDATISSLKTLTGEVTLKDISFVGSQAKVNDIKVAPITNCWIDTQSNTEVLVSKKVDFANLNIGNFDITTPSKVGNTMASLSVDSASGTYGTLGPEKILTPSTTDYWHSGGEENPWIKLRIDEEAEVISIKVVDRVGSQHCCQDRFNLVEVKVGDVSCGIQSYIDSITYTYNCPANTRGNTILIKKLGSTSFLHISLVEVSITRLPRFNDVQSIDFARLDQANEFCKAGSPCAQSFTAGVDVDTMLVDGNVVDGGLGKTVFGVDIADMDTKRFSLSRTETVSGDYKFQLLTSSKFTGPISYHYQGRDQSFYDYVSKFLKKTDANAQTFTRNRKFGQLKSSSQVVTGVGAGTVAITAPTKEGSDFNIKAIYDAAFKLDAASNTIPSTSVPFTFNDELKVSKDIDVTGTVEGVNLKTLVKDLVVNGDDISVTHGGETFSITGTNNPITFTGKKTFSKSPTVKTSVARNIDAANNKVWPEIASTKVGASKASLSVDSVSSIFYHHKAELALTPDTTDHWHSSTEENPWIKFRMAEEAEVTSIKVVDRETPIDLRDRFERVEVKVGDVSCGIQSYINSVTYTYNCPENTRGNSILIKKLGTTTFFHIGYVEVSTYTNLFITYFDNLDGTTRVLERSDVSAEREMTGKLTITGNIQINGDLQADTIDGVTVSSINDNYVYDGVNKVHELKTAFNFAGDLSVTSLTCAVLRGRTWQNFMNDIIPLTSDTTIVLSGDKQFSSTLELTKTDASVSGTVNDVNLSDMVANLAYIDTAATFTGASNSFNSATSSSIPATAKLTATTKLTLTNPKVGTSFDIDWVYANTILINSDQTHTIEGKLKFQNDLSLSADSTVGSLGDGSLTGIEVPEDLILLNTAAVITGFHGKCFQDFESRIFEHRAGGTSYNTVEKCLKYCWDSGYFYAGLQFGNECSCGMNAPSPYKPAPSTDCHMACAGNSEQKCGASWRSNVYSKMNHQFEGVDVGKGLKLTGQLGGHDLVEFHDALYKSDTSIMSGSRTFSKVKMAKEMTSTGLVNNLDLATNLVYLASDVTLEGKYSFAELDVKNAQVNGKVDGVEWDSVDASLFKLDQEQTVSATYSFASPSTSITFQGAVVGDGVDSGNGAGRINGQKVESMGSADSSWDAVAAVKVAAQAEANVACKQVKALHKAYINNVEDSFYSLAKESGTLSATDFTMFKSIHSTQKTLLIGLTSSKIFILLGILGNDNKADFTKLEEVTLLDSNGDPVTNARSLEIIPIQKTGTIKFIALVVCDQGLVIVDFKGTLSDSDDTGSFISNQVVEPSSNIVGISYIPSSSRIIVVKEFFVPSADGFMTFVRSHPIPQIFGNFLEFSSCMMKQPTCPKLDMVDDIWRGNTAASRVENPKMDVVVFGDRILIAVTKDDNTATVIDVGFSWAPSSQISYNMVSSVTNVYTEMNQFTFFINEDKVYLASAGKRQITLFKLEDGSYTEHSAVFLESAPTSLTRFQDDKLVVVVGNLKLQMFEYGGGQGLKLAGTIHQGRSATINTFSFVPTPATTNNLLVTGNTNGKLKIFEAIPNFDYTALDIACREPEPMDRSSSNIYCQLLSGHTMCVHDGPSDSCDILNMHLRDDFKDILVNKINEFRRDIANGEVSLGDDKLPAASNMEMVEWDDELARLAERWASQCPTGLETLRTVIHGTDNTQSQYSQNIVEFKFPLEVEPSSNQIEEVVNFWYNSVSDLKTEGDSRSLETIIAAYQAAKDNSAYFTQLAWATTSKVGCGWTQYKSQVEDYPVVSVMVCNYLRAGNEESEPVYKSGTPCSFCPEGYQCEEGVTNPALCVKN